MFRHRESRFAASVLLLFFLAMDLHCWEPGGGGRRDVVDGKRAKGTDVEMYYGWPACYRAELWRSADMTAYDRVLRNAPLFFPQGQMDLAYRNVGSLSLLLDVLFAALSLRLTGVLVDCIVEEKWPKRSTTLILALAGALAVLYSVADGFYVGL